MMINPFRQRRSVSPVVNRLLELCVHYQQQQQNSQNAPSSSLSTQQTADLNQQAERRIKALVKALAKSKRPQSIDELEKAILHRDSKTRCVIVPRAFETSQNPSRSNCVVEYCRLWRWPDLSNVNELKPVDYCPHAFHYHHDDICVNPFHYERVPTTYSVCVPRLPPEMSHPRHDLRSSSMNSHSQTQIPQNATYHTPIDQQSAQSPPSLSPESISSVESFRSPADLGNPDDNTSAMDTDHPPTTVSFVAPHPPPPLVPAAPAPDSNLTGERVPFEEPREWCRLSYYEMAQRVGEQYRATQPQVVIDGFTNPSNADRFCLGGLANVHRTEEIDRIRRHIGRGVKLYHIRGNVFAECLSGNPVFVQSPIANRRQGWHPATVVKIEPNVRFQIFDSDDFTDVLRQAILEGYESVFNLTKMCILRMSLVKGWGVDYGRPTVTGTPCWLEIHLDGPLKWLDTVLLTMRGPSESITSVS